MTSPAAVGTPVPLSVDTNKGSNEIKEVTDKAAPSVVIKSTISRNPVSRNTTARKKTTARVRRQSKATVSIEGAEFADNIKDLYEYTEDDQLGSGVSGVVYRAKRNSDGLIVALKISTTKGLHHRGIMFVK